MANIGCIKVVAEGRIKGITMQKGNKQQCISKYVDTSSFIIRGDKYDVHKLVRLLKTFSVRSWMEINWENLCSYWFDKYTHKPKWMVWYEMGKGRGPIQAFMHPLWIQLQSLGCGLFCLGKKSPRNWNTTTLWTFLWQQGLSYVIKCYCQPCDFSL